jgi:lipopolysaccharide export system protein LptA
MSKLKNSIAAALVFVIAGATSAEQATMVADSMRYDPAAAVITASGSVHITHPDGEVFGDNGSGSVDGANFEIHGGVKGYFNDQDGIPVSLECADAYLTTADDGTRTLTAIGSATLTKRAEKLSADSITWNSSGDRYSALGGVLGDFEAYVIDADTVSRDARIFSARTVRKFHEKTRNITMSADKADGVIVNERISELVATGGVVITAPDKNGSVTRATGSKGVYSLDKGTVVVTGRATITQTGRRLNSERIVYYVDTGRIDATGNPALTFETERKN